MGPRRVGHDRFARHHRMGSERFHARHREGGGQFVTGDDGSGIDEALVAVNDSGKIDVRVGLREELGERVFLNNDGKGWWSHHVGVPSCPGRIDIKVDRIGRENRSGKLAHLFAADEGLLAFAALYSWWRESPSSDWVLTVTILTMAAPEPIAWLHDRTPVVLAREDWGVWLDRGTSADQVFVDDIVERSLPVASQLHAVEVNPLRGDGPELLQPADRGRL